MNALRSTMTAALGAVGMYWLDPARGRSRRARARDVFEHAVHASLHGLDAASRDLSHRVHGAVVEARRTTPVRVSDDVLAGRVRARVGRLCSHPHAIGVQCQGGRVTLGGPILYEEAQHLVAGVRAVPGVGDVDALRDRHTSAAVPALQGGVPHPTWQRRLIPAYWPPAIRLLVGGAGAVLAGYGFLRRGVVGAVAELIGTAALARSMTNLELGALFGVGPHRLGIHVAKTLTIKAPVAEVFESFTDFESFPRFMRHVRDVKKLDDNRFHWSVEGPAGIAFEWDGIVMQNVPGKFVSWTSAESASVHHSGSASFEAVPGGTRMMIHMDYEPPLGLAGHELAKLFGADPKRELDEDMLRFQSLIEHGKATGAGGTVTRAEVAAVHALH